MDPQTSLSSEPSQERRLQFAALWNSKHLKSLGLWTASWPLNHHAESPHRPSCVECTETNPRKTRRKAYTYMVLYNNVYLMNKCPEQTWEQKVRDHPEEPKERYSRGVCVCGSWCVQSVQRRGKADDKSCELENEKTGKERHWGRERNRALSVPDREHGMLECY